MDLTARSDTSITVGQYDYSTLIHWWLNNYEIKSTAGGRLTAKYNLLYSYSTVIAELTITKKGAPYVRFNIRRYSTTTTRQQNLVRDIIDYPILKSTRYGSFELADYYKELSEELEAYKRKRTPTTKLAQKLLIKSILNSIEFIEKEVLTPKPTEEQAKIKMLAIMRVQ